MTVKKKVVAKVVAKLVRRRKSVEELAALRGARYLDETKPGWAAGVNLNTLRMMNARVCILGQCFGNFFDQLRRVHGSSDSTAAGNWAVKHGFQVTFTNGRAENGAYERLALAWAPLVGIRQVKRTQQAGTN